jgi:hypothetical protein
MLTHLVRANPTTNAHGEMLAWCGRYVRPNRATTAVRESHCKQCHDAFARVLRRLPDVIPAAKG